MTKNFYLIGDRHAKKHATVCRKGNVACPPICQCWCHGKFQSDVDIAESNIKEALQIIDSFTEQRRDFIAEEGFDLDSIENTLRGILDWITSKDHVTEKQSKAIENILEGLKQWV